MTSEIEGLDLNKIVTNLVQANAEWLRRLAGRGVKATSRHLRARLDAEYGPYLESVLKQYSTARSIVLGTSSAELYDLFVPLDVEHGNEIFPRATFDSLRERSSRILISGLGGSGKSMLMRHLLIGAAMARRTPIFVELRQMNGTGRTLNEHILHTVQLHGLRADDTFLNIALAAGRFVVLLDGFDELDLDIRDGVATSIRANSIRWPNSEIIVSSRPDIELTELDGFFEAEVSPLDLDAAIELVDRLPYDPDVKAKFTAGLRRDLYETHQSFLSNPLLLSIMLLTYADRADIPAKLSLFYEQAFDALFQRHDAHKGVFSRPRNTSLDLQDFATAFSAFCVLSYSQTMFEFPTRMIALETIDRSRGLSRLDFESEPFLKDCIQSVCLLLEDGITIAFVHRSFQEYFAARYISRLSDQATKAKLIDRLGARTPNDAAMRLLHELDPLAVETHYIVPWVATIRDRTGASRPSIPQDRLALLQALFDSISIHEDGRGGVSILGRRLSSIGLLEFLSFAEELTGTSMRDAEPSLVEEVRSLLPMANGERQRVEIPTAALTPEHRAFQYMDATNYFFMGETLDSVLELAEIARRNQEELSSSLEALLGTAARTSLRSSRARDKRLMRKPKT